MIKPRWMKAVFLAVVCTGAAAVQAEAPSRHPITVIFAGGIVDADGNALGPSSDPSTLLYSAALGNPLLAPDGHHLTWGEWRQPIVTNTSEASIKCVNKGTHVVLKLNGLLPNALYSVWLFIRSTPSSPIDSGALPSLAPGNNGFVTNGRGSATVSVIAPAGPLSVSGQITDCLFDLDAFAFFIAYHSDGRLYGDVPGPDGITFVQVIINP